MKLGILETGRPPKALRPQFGDYPGMFRALLGESAYDYRTFDVREGGPPDAVEACDAYLVTGSPAGVYDDRPWIVPLMDFLRAARGRAPLVGICFGHQAMAQAFGGRVEKAARGRVEGLQTYVVARREPWMEDVANFRAAASHQDQVVDLPPDARIVAGNEFSPFGMLAYGGDAMSLQLHPEFATDYARALVAPEGSPYEVAAGEAALRSYDQPDDRFRVAGWIRDFLARAKGG
jgi:GMP synthase-like glutamine amidotransferase